MAKFNFFLNRQGVQGRKGEKGDTGFSPTISVGTDTLDEYKLIIANESNSFETPNLRGNINIQDNGGTYLRYDTETKQISAQSMDAATADTIGGVRLSTEADIVEMGAGSVVTPSDVADALPLYLEGEGAVTITQDELTSKTKIKVDIPSVNDLESRMSTAEAEITDIQTDVANLNNNKVAKTDLATTESAGIVKVDGTSITVTADGTISASPSGALPIASTTQLGGVKVDGTSIIADENGVISSVGGGGAGDVTASGDNEFTGNNTFKKSVRVDNSTDPYQNTFINYNGLSIGTSSGAEINIHDNLTPKPLKFIASKLTLSNAYDGSSESPIVTSDKLKAGENITLNKNAETGDITISSTGGGGGGTPTNMVTTDTTQKITASKEFDTYNYPLIFYGNRTQDTSSSGSSFLQIQGNHIYQKEPGGNPVEYVRQHIKAGDGISLSANDESVTISTTGGDVPIATTTTAGKVKPDGTTITVTEDGTISANSSYTLPTASTTQLGGVKVDGTSVTINSDGVISATGGGGSTPTNMVTTDSDQTINGTKTFANGIGTVFKGTSSNSNSVVIDGDDKEIRFNSENQSDAVIKNQGWNSANLNIGQNFNSVKITTTLYDKNGNEIVGGSTGDIPIATTTTAGKVKPDGTTITVTEDGTISAVPTTPSNMVTTDTSQNITGAKTFTEPIVFQNTLDMSTGGTDTLNIYATGSYAEGYTTDIKFHKNLNIKGQSGGGAITLAPYSSGLSALKYKDSSNTSNPSYDILHTGNLVTGNNITISEPNSTGVRTISGPSNEYMASMAFPSTSYVDLNLGASPTKFIAPANGWFDFVSNATTAGGQYCRLLDTKNTGLRQSSYASGAKQYIELMIPVYKGQEISVYYTAPVSTFRFYYAESSKPTT